MYLPKQVRDLTLIPLNETETLVIACDSAGGIGPKPGDVIQVPGEVLGRFICRVALMEVLASGAAPLAIVDTVCVEMDPTGRAILEGIRAEARLAGLDPEQAVTGSTEENVPVSQSGIGVTVIGLVHPGSFRPGKAQSGDKILCFGIPKVGNEIVAGLQGDPEIADIPLVLQLREKTCIHDLLPVGSKGIAYEAQALCQSAGKELRLYPDLPLDLAKSAGPATCLLAAVPAECAEGLLKEFFIPVHVIGEVLPICGLE